MSLKAGGNRHITFDEDEDFENLPTLESLSKSTSDGAEEEDGENSDSDTAPEEATITAGKEEAQKEEDAVKSEINKRKQHIKEKRKQQHEKNKLQQEEKRRRLDERRLPQSLLDAAATEQKTRPGQQKAGAPTRKKKRKMKTFGGSDGDDDGGGTVENVDEDGLITIDTSVKVHTLKEETKKTNEIMRRAADFRQNALYGGNTRRMPTEQLRQMKVKRAKSGKAVFGGVKKALDVLSP